MDDDGSKTLSYDEFKKGLQGVGVSVTDAVSTTHQLAIFIALIFLYEPVGSQGGFWSF